MVTIVAATAFFALAFLAGLFANGWPEKVSDYPSLLTWLSAPPNHWFVLNAGITALGTLIGLVGFFGSKPYTAEQGRADRQHQNASFKATDERQDARHDAQMAELAEIKAMLEARVDEVEAKDPQQAAGFAEATGKLVKSGDADNLARTREVAEGRAEEAADALMRRALDGKLNNAERFRQAARIVGSAISRSATRNSAISPRRKEIWQEPWPAIGSQNRLR